MLLRPRVVVASLHGNQPGATINSGFGYYGLLDKLPASLGSGPLNPKSQTLAGFTALGLGALGFRVQGFIVEARKLEHQYPHALKVEYRGS